MASASRPLPPPNTSPVRVVALFKLTVAVPTLPSAEPPYTSQYIEAAPVLMSDPTFTMAVVVVVPEPKPPPKIPSSVAAAVPIEPPTTDTVAVPPIVPLVLHPP